MTKSTKNHKYHKKDWQRGGWEKKNKKIKKKKDKYYKKKDRKHKKNKKT